MQHQRSRLHWRNSYFVSRHVRRIAADAESSMQRVVVALWQTTRKTLSMYEHSDKYSKKRNMYRVEKGKGWDRMKTRAEAEYSFIFDAGAESFSENLAFVSREKKTFRFFHTADSGGSGWAVGTRDDDELLALIVHYFPTISCT